MSVETTLPHGLKTSILTSPYKIEYDQNLTLLDNDRITVGAVSSRPAFGVARRFWFDPTTKQISYDDGTQWVEDLTRQTSLIVESLSILNQDLTTDADVIFNSISSGSLITSGAISASDLSLTTPLPQSSGGTGSSTSDVIFNSISLVSLIASGAISASDLSLTTPLPQSSGGTGSSTSDVIFNSISLVSLTVSTGNVAIGNTSALAKLHVTLGGTLMPTIGVTTVGIFQNTGLTDSALSIIAGNTNSSILNFGDTDSETVGAIRYLHSDNSMRFDLGGIEKVQVDGMGIGIGGITPTNALHIKGSVDLNTSGIHIRNINVAHTWQFTAGLTLTYNDGFAFGNDAEGTYLTLRASKIGMFTTNPVSELDVNGTITATGLTVNGTITASNTNVASLTTSNLTVNGIVESTTGGIKFPDATVQTTASLAGKFFDGTNPADAVYIIGNVGIGNINPLTRLHVTLGGTLMPAIGVDTVAVFQNNTSNHSHLSIIASNTRSSILNFGDTDSEFPGSIQFAHTSNAMLFKINSITAMTILNNRTLSLANPLPVTSGGTGLQSSNVTYLNLGKYFTMEKTTGQTLLAGDNIITGFTGGNGTNNTFTANLASGTLTVLSNGRYFINVSIKVNTAVGTFIKLTLLKNGSPITENGTDIQNAGSSLTQFRTMTINIIVTLFVNDVLTIKVNGGAIAGSVIGTGNANYIQGFYITL